MLCNWKGHLIRWLCGGVLYGLLEVAWRGYTHWTMMVLAAGLILNVWLGLGIWDYSGMWGNLWGQICPLYTLLWCLLAGPVIVGFDWLDHWLCGGERPRYRLI